MVMGSSDGDHSQPFLRDDADEETRDQLSSRVWVESKKLWSIAGPAMFSRLASYSMNIITQAFAGHLGDVELAAISIANTVIAGFNFGLLLGMASALETLCGQAFGAKRYHMLGIYMQRSWIVLFLFCFLLLPVYIFASPILKWLGQTDDVAEMSGVAAMWMIPMHFSFAFQFPLQRFLQCQLKNQVIAWVSLVCLFVNVLTSWLLVYVLDWGVIGAAIALDISCWFWVAGLFAYIVFGRCPLTWTGFSMHAFSGLWEYTKLSVASGIMLCLENWYYRILILLPGFLENATIAVDALSVCMSINGWQMMIPLAFFAATGVRVANELGARNGEEAKFATIVSVVQSTIIGIIFCILILILKDKVALIFTSNEDVLQEVKTLSYLLAVTILLNSVQPILSGVAVGSGWQAKVAYINLGCYYIIGLPLGILMGRFFHLGVMGIWGGMIFGGTAIQTIILAIITARSDWEKEAEKANQRVKRWSNPEIRVNKPAIHHNFERDHGDPNQPFLRDHADEQNKDQLSRKFWIESKKLWRIVGPAIFSRVSTYTMNIITQAFAGHLGDVELAAISIANTVIVGFNFGLLLGMASALETLCGQAFGAKRYHMLGIYMQRSWIVLFFFCFLLLPFYIYASPILKWLGQPDDVAELSGVVAVWLIPLHFSFAFLFPLQRFLQCQLKNQVIAWVSLVGLIINVLSSWLLVYVLDWGVIGAAFALNISWWILIFGLFGYTAFGGCPLTWSGFSMQAFSGLWEYTKLSVASGVMLCLENWYYRILILMTGYLKNATVTVDALSVCMSINGWQMMIPLAFFAATGVRVANELGAGNGKAAQFATIVSVIQSTVIGLIFCFLILIFSDKVALIFTSSEDVLQEVDTLSYLLAVTILFNSIQPILSGVAVGSGWQATVAYINIGCYYIIGLPLGILMGWVFKLGVMGIWGGMIFGGTAIQTVILAIITVACNWENEAEKANERVKKWSKLDADNQSEEQLGQQ